MTHGPLFDLAESRAARDEALLHVETGAPEWWKAKARRLVLDAAHLYPSFTADHVWAAGLESPSEPRALGAIMNGLARQGFIEKTGRYIPTSRKKSHAAPITEWRAKVVQNAGVSP